MDYIEHLNAQVFSVELCNKFTVTTSNFRFPFDMKLLDISHSRDQRVKEEKKVSVDKIAKTVSICSVFPKLCTFSRSFLTVEDKATNAGF